MVESYQPGYIVTAISPTEPSRTLCMDKVKEDFLNHRRHQARRGPPPNHHQADEEDEMGQLRQQEIMKYLEESCNSR